MEGENKMISPRVKNENLPTLVEALKFRMEQYGHNNRQASKAIGISEQKVCHILKGQRDVSRSMQWKLYKYGIPPVVLIQPPRKV